MARLFVNNFSSISDGDIEPLRLTAIIGPQASGKSVLSKLFYFFNGLDRALLDASEEGIKPREIQLWISERFSTWFPARAWGKKIFRIDFCFGDQTIRIHRRGSRSRPTDHVNVELPQSILELYGWLQSANDENTERKNKHPAMTFERDWRKKSEFLRRFRRTAPGALYSEQMFVPAGRSFFTTLGRAILAFDSGTTLDPITHRFGRYYFNAKDDRFTYRPSIYRRVVSQKELDELIGGKVKIEREREFLVTADERQVPFSALSSGQQELMPLMVVLRDLHETPRSGQTGRNSLLYVEEPEAHLFPSYQRSIINILAGVAGHRSSQFHVFVTTHSPYILAQLNNHLIAAQKIKQKKKHVAEVQQIMGTSDIVPMGETSVYAIDKGKTLSLINKDGLIDASYIDSASDLISEQFDKLMEID